MEWHYTCTCRPLHRMTLHVYMQPLRRACYIGWHYLWTCRPQNRMTHVYMQPLRRGLLHRMTCRHYSCTCRPQHRMTLHNYTCTYMAPTQDDTYMQGPHIEWHYLQGGPYIRRWSLQRVTSIQQAKSSRDSDLLGQTLLCYQPTSSSSSSLA